MVAWLLFCLLFWHGFIAEQNLKLSTLVQTQFNNHIVKWRNHNSCNLILVTVTHLLFASRNQSINRITKILTSKTSAILNRLLRLQNRISQIERPKPSWRGVIDTHEREVQTKSSRPKNSENEKRDPKRVK